MKILRVVALMMTLVLLLVGCQAKGLLSYQKAVQTTDAIKTGELQIDVDVRTEFNKMGLSIAEEKDLSTFEEMKTKINIKFDDNRNLMETNIYYIIGAMGIDSSIFLIDNELMIQLPIINMYMKLNEEDLKEFEEKQEEDDFLDMSIIDFTKLLESWLSVFREDNVVVGKNTYVNTDEGQIKTTTYSFHLDEDQLSRLEENLLAQLDVEAVNKMITDNGIAFVDEDELEAGEVTFNVEEALDSIHLTHLEGEAYVDYDNRLIRQTFILYGEGTDPVPGNLQTFEIEMTMTYSNLGEEIQFDIPEFNEDNMINQDQLNEIFDQFN